MRTGALQLGRTASSKIPPAIPEVSLSDRIAAITAGPSDRVSISEIIDGLGRLATSIAMLFFAALNVVPAPPGTSLFFGMPLVIAAWQNMTGRPLWLPRFILDMRLSKSHLETFLEKLNAGLDRAHRVIRKRGHWFHGASASLLIRASLFLLALVVLIPLPFTAMLPAFAICVITLGRIEGDGIMISIGLFLGAIAVFIVSTMLYASIRLVSLLFT